MTYPGFIRRRLLTYSPVILVAIAIVILGVYLNQLRFNYQVQELRHSLFNQLSVVRAKFEGNINSNAQLVKGLVIAISTEPEMTQERFRALSKPLFLESSQLKNIAAAPNLIIKYMYPLEGNESAVGLSYKNNSTQYQAVKKAVDLDKLVIAGPVTLVQGGQGFIARIPVFISPDTKGKKKLWGIISAVIDTEKLYLMSGIHNNESDFDLAIRGKDALGEQGAVFFGKEDIFNLSPVLVDVTLPYGSWQLAAIPKGGWPKHLENQELFILALVAIGFIILIPLIILGRFLEKRRESETLLSGLFELSPIGIALNDYETGGFVKINSALVTPTGYSREEFLNLSYWDLTPIEFEAQEKIQLESLEKHNEYGPYEKEYIRKDGSRYPVLLRGIVVYSTSGKKMIWSIVEDISDQKRNEKMKDEFISIVSHELRTPLTSISGAVSLALGGAFGELPAQANEIFKVAKLNAERLSFLINDLLDIEKLYAKKMKFDMLVQNLISQVRDAVKINQSYADKYNIELRFIPGIDKVDVSIDYQRLQQVLANLISNAVKFTSKHNHVDIKVKLVNESVRVEVTDYGLGIPKEFYNDVFKKFAQADSSDTRAKGGTGLGLSISREIIEQMNGTIGFESIEGEGSTFYFELPVVYR
ncbi:MAG: ATP-binding protein [Gammaproteobacteria bacterium]|nr:ATP-binding protein [Gammaproteobacteria bacterium]